MVTLDKWDSHLDCSISEDGLNTLCLHENGFQYMWKGCRSTHGVTSGAYVFEVKVLENLKVIMPDTDANTQNILRVGCSMPLSSLFLGDTNESWGFGGTGKKSHGGEFIEYGQKFTVGDVIGVIMDLDNLSISFMKNGIFMGYAFDDINPAVKQTGLFPHLLMKNVRCQVNFSRETKWFPPPPNVYFLDEADDTCPLIDNPVEHPRRLDEAEFIMMVGLPACGKTYWALKFMEENPKKNYTLLGTNTVIDQMKVVGLARKGNYAERWQELITQATPVFNRLCTIAGKTTRHIILDQTNVFQAARQKKVQEYQNFGIRRGVVIVNDEDVLQQRTEKRECEEGKFVPVNAVMGMKQNFSSPTLSEGFTHVDFVEAPEAEATRLIKQYNEAGLDFSKRNGKGKGGGGKGKPKKPIEERNASDFKFDRHGFQQAQRIPETPDEDIGIVNRGGSGFGMAGSCGGLRGLASRMGAALEKVAPSNTVDLISDDEDDEKSEDLDALSNEELARRFDAAKEKERIQQMGRAMNGMQPLSSTGGFNLTGRGRSRSPIRTSGGLAGYDNPGLDLTEDCDDEGPSEPAGLNALGTSVGSLFGMRSFRF